jgi:hypothetical protein
MSWYLLEANITLVPEGVFTWRSLVGKMVPPRDPNDDAVEQDNDDGEADGNREPPVIREPDEDE